MASDVRHIPRKFRRTANACIPCRQSKIKCSGEEPCANCQRRVVKCRFMDSGNRVLVAERYLQELQQKAKDQECVSKRKRSSEIAFGDEDTETGCPQRLQQRSMTDAPSVWTSPFTLPSVVLKNTHHKKRKWIWLAPSSLWSLAARLAFMLTERFNLEPLDSAPGFLDGDIYNLQWRSSPGTDSIDVSGLPSIDYALYLFNTVKFHLGQNYRFFDEEEFMRNVHEFYYGNAADKATECRLWFVQFLLVLAFGNAFLSRSKNSRDPSGSKWFVRAMSLIPDFPFLQKDSLLAIEVLAMAGLYLYSIDHRESAHVYVGQAIRIAQLDGLHTELPENDLGPATLTRCRNLWWTLYIMDRHVSSALGLPMTTHDSEITTLVDAPSACSQRDATMSLQVRMSQLLSSILTTIYKNERTPLGTFLEQTKSILHTMAGHAEEIERIIQMKFQNSVDTMPRGTRHITLSYHQCVIVATRPLLLSALKSRLDKLDDSQQEDWQTILAPTKTLISTGIKSAIKTLQILSDEDSLLEVFLPFDLEFTYGAAIHLTMTRALFPRVVEDDSYSQLAHGIFDEMIHKGNRIAEARKAELGHLEVLFRELAVRIERQGLQGLSLESPDSQRGAADCTLDSSAVDTVAFMAGDGNGELSPSQEASNLEFLDNIGISSYEFLSIVDQIGQDNLGLLDEV